MAHNYSHLLAKPETKKQVMEMLNKTALSEQGATTIKDWIVFEKEAQAMIDYLQNNPRASEEDLVETVLQIAWNYAQAIGMTPGHRECYSVKM